MTELDLRAQATLLRAALVVVVGADTEPELREIEAVLRQMPSTPGTRASLCAVGALLATLPRLEQTA